MAYLQSMGEGFLQKHLLGCNAPPSRFSFLVHIQPPLSPPEGTVTMWRLWLRAMVGSANLPQAKITWKVYHNAGLSEPDWPVGMFLWVLP